MQFDFLEMPIDNNTQRSDLVKCPGKKTSTSTICGQASNPNQVGAMRHLGLTLPQTENWYLAQILIPSPKISKRLWWLVV
jgi:hypothetical protein